MQLRLPIAHDLGLLILRVAVGAVMTLHGAQKLFGVLGGSGISGFAGWMESLGVPLPQVSAYLAGGTEFLGGLAFITGFGMRLMSIPMAFTMLVAVVVTFESGFFAQSGGFEYALVLGLAIVSLGLIGPGRFALGSGDRN